MSRQPVRARLFLSKPLFILCGVSTERLRLAGEATRLGVFFLLMNRFGGNFAVVDVASAPA